MNRYEEVRAFVAFVGTGSLAGAAREVKVTPSMIGRRLTGLEQRLDTRLLDRSTRPMTLTEQGKLFFDQCRTVLAQLEGGEAAVFPDATHPKGELTIVAPPFLGRTHVAPHVPAFSRAYPNVRISLDLTNEYVERVLETCDLRIRHGTVIDPNFVSVWLAANRRVICATPEYLRTRGRPETLHDLGDHDCAAVRSMAGPRGEWRVQDSGHPVRIRTAGRFDTNDGEALARWVVDGNAIGWRSAWEIAPYIATGALETVLDEYTLPNFDVYAVYPRNKPLTRPLKLFIDMLRDAFASREHGSVPPV